MEKEKKEIWMEKLIELLLEYKPQIHYLDKPKGVYDKKYWIGWYKREWDIGWWFSEEVIISKKFWFIKWLVENDKIDIKKAKEWEIMLSRNDEENIIWKLSISDTPIDFLCEILK